MAGTPQQPIKAPLSCDKECCHLFSPERLRTVLVTGAAAGLKGTKAFTLGPLGESGLGTDPSSPDGTTARRLAMTSL